LIAAEKTGRVCRGVEVDPLYVDVIVRRYEIVTGREAVLEETGESFAALTARRAREGGERRQGASATSGTPDAAGDR
jgi:DNA modification methylase